MVIWTFYYYYDLNRKKQKERTLVLSDGKGQMLESWPAAFQSMQLASLRQWVAMGPGVDAGIDVCYVTWAS